MLENSGGSSSDSEESESEGIDALQIALREKEEALVQSALRRIRRAQEKGKREVKLNQEELDALENRRKRMQAAATTKARKGSGSSGGSGSEKKRRSDRNIIIPIAPPETASRPSSRPSSSRRSSKGKSKQDHLPATTIPPGYLVAGADGLTYAPVGSSQQPTASNRNFISRPRASTASQPMRGPHGAYVSYQPGNQRHASESMRPASSASNRARPMPDEEGWMPTTSRRSSGGSNYVVDPFEYQVSSDTPPPIPAQYMTSQPLLHTKAGRRTVSGPQEVTYSSVRRSLPPGAAFQRAPIPDAFLYQQREELDDFAEGYSSGSSSSEDESDDDESGVQVFVDEREAERERVPRKPVGGKKNRKRLQ